MERYFSGNDLRQLFSLNPSPCEVSRVKALFVATLLELTTNAILRAPARRRTTCSSASAAKTVAKSSRLRRCSMAIPRREFLCGPTICPASAFIVDFGGNACLARRPGGTISATKTSPRTTTCCCAPSTALKVSRLASSVSHPGAPHVDMVVSLTVPAPTLRYLDVRRKSKRQFCPLACLALWLALPPQCHMYSSLSRLLSHLHPAFLRSFEARGRTESSWSRVYSTPAHASFRTRGSMESEYNVVGVGEGGFQDSTDAVLKGLSR